MHRAGELEGLCQLKGAQHKHYIIFHTNNIVLFLKTLSSSRKLCLKLAPRGPGSFLRVPQFSSAVQPRVACQFMCARVVVSRGFVFDHFSSTVSSNKESVAFRRRVDVHAWRQCSNIAAHVHSHGPLRGAVILPVVHFPLAPWRVHLGRVQVSLARSVQRTCMHPLDGSGLAGERWRGDTEAN
jgi:hypothetical protein